MTMRTLSVSLLLCAVMAWTTAAATAGEHAVVKRCPSDWTEWNGHCYIFEKAKMAWADAEKTCVSQGGNLASIHYKREHTFLQGLIHSSALTWIGGYDVTGTNGGWLWSDGSPMTFTDWRKKEPNNYRGSLQNCMEMEHGLLWDDVGCSYKFASVCKKRAEST